jgi:hypothetical protein
MKTLTNLMVIPTTLALILSGAIAARSDAPTLEIGQQLRTNPITVQGKSGGTNNSRNCGYTAASPNQQVRLTQRLDYLRFSVQGEGEPTLLVEGPGGRFCVFADADSGEKPEISGVWLPGTYAIYVGDRVGGQHQYTLSISDKK